MLKRTQTDLLQSSVHEEHSSNQIDRRVFDQRLEGELSSDKTQTDAVFITVNELNGTSHGLGWFPADVKVGELKRCASEEMCVPVEALQFAYVSATGRFDNEERYTHDGLGGEIAVAVRLPVGIVEILESTDDVRTHESAYETLVELACAFDGKRSTSMNLNFLRGVVALIHEGLRNARHNICRCWAIEALGKLLQHSTKQLISWNTDCPEDLKMIIRNIADIFGGLLESELWLDRREACEHLGRLSDVAHHCTGLVAFQIGLLCKYCCSIQASGNEKALAYKVLALLVQSAPRDHKAVQDSLYSVGEVVSKELEVACQVAKPFMKTLQSLLRGSTRMRGASGSGSVHGNW